MITFFCSNMYNVIKFISDAPTSLTGYTQSDDVAAQLSKN